MFWDGSCIAEGDIVRAIDGVAVAGKKIDQVRRMIAGPVGTEVMCV